jgi:hypothetical protein
VSLLVGSGVLSSFLFLWLRALAFTRYLFPSEALFCFVCVQRGQAAIMHRHTHTHARTHARLNALARLSVLGLSD